MPVHQIKISQNGQVKDKLELTRIVPSWLLTTASHQLELPGRFSCAASFTISFPADPNSRPNWTTIKGTKVGLAVALSFHRIWANWKVVLCDKLHCQSSPNLISCCASSKGSVETKRAVWSCWFKICELNALGVLAKGCHRIIFRKYASFVSLVVVLKQKNDTVQSSKRPFNCGHIVASRLHRSFVLIFMTHSHSQDSNQPPTLRLLSAAIYQTSLFVVSFCCCFIYLLK